VKPSSQSTTDTLSRCRRSLASRSLASSS
jgi:hypothetical protein